LAGQLLDADKYWVKHSVKIELTKEEKLEISGESIPRPEIDIIAMDVSLNTVYLFEIKSYLDSKGVDYEDVIKETTKQEGYYKLLTCKNYRNVLTKRLKKDWLAKGFINKATKFSYGLIAGKVYKKREAELGKYCKKKKWLFWGASIIKEKLNELSGKGYENNAVTIAAKLILRADVSKPDLLILIYTLLYY